MVSSRILFEIQTDHYALRVVRYPAFRQMPAHAHEDCGVSVVLDGQVVEEAEHRTVLASAGWAVTKPRGIEHANRFGQSGATMIALTPRDSETSAALKTWGWVNNPTGLRTTLRLVAQNRNASAANDADAVAELVACLAPLPAITRPPLWLRRVRDTLDDPDAPSVARLAADAGIHPVYLARAFRGAFGVSIREYRQLVQVRRAAQLILGSRLSLSQIALECGFSDHSHMCRSFRLVAGWSPATLRSPKV